MAWGDNNNNNQGPWGGSPWGKPSGGEPSGGGRKPSGKDFEEQIRRIQQQLRDKIGGGGDGSGDKRIFMLVVFSVIVLWMASGIYLVRPEEQGVVLRFGQYHRTSASGLNYHLPYPFESVLTPRVTVINRVEIGKRAERGRIQTADADADASNLDERLMLTGDENILDINFEVQWQVGSAPDYLFNVRNPEMTVKTVAESAMREVIGRTNIATALAEGKLEIAEATKKLLQQTLDEYKAGINIVSVNLLDTDPPTQVIDAFRDVQTARADMETARNQAEAYRNDIIPRARGEAEKLVLDAEGYKREVIARAQGEASRFSSIYNEYKLSKDVTQKRMYLETMEEILSGMNKVIVDGKSAQGVLPYLPLPDIKDARKNKAEAGQ